MKKNILNPLLFIAALSVFTITNTVQAQSVNKITISVKEIEYDDPNFAALRETLKKNPKVKLVKPSYTAGVAILSFNYAGEASQLWEEIPKTSKRFFNLGELGDDAISLNYINPKKNPANSTAVTNAAQSKTTNKKDCFDCDYFPLCNYDVKKTFGGGHVYRGIRESDQSIIYYNCENGIVTRKWVTSSNPQYSTVDYDPFTKTETVIYYEGQPVYTTHTEIILNSNVPKGKSWNGERLHTYYTIEKKDTSVVFDGIKYNNVIVVHSDLYQYVDFYAKGIGKIKRLDYNEYKKQIGLATLARGIIDPDLIGAWYQDKGPGYEMYLFEANGSGRSLARSTSTSFIRWSVIDNMLYILEDGDLLKYGLEKLSPSIKIRGITYNRSPWKDPKKDPALNRQLIESQRFRFVATMGWTSGGRPMTTRLYSYNVFIIKKDSIIVSLPRNEEDAVTQFSSSKFTSSYSSDNYGNWKIDIHIKDKKDFFPSSPMGLDFRLSGNYNSRNADLWTGVRFSGYIIDLDGH